MCIICGEMAQFDNDGQPTIKIEEPLLSELLRREPRLKTAQFIVKARASAGSPEKRKEYEDKIASMIDQVTEWRKKNPGYQPVIQYNFQSNTTLIAALSDAIEQHFMSADPETMRMLEELGWLQDGPTMPSVTMVKIAMDLAFV